MIRPYRPTDPAGSMKFTKVDCQHEPTGSWLMQREGAEFRQQAVTLASKAVPYHVIYPIRCAGPPHVPTLRVAPPQWRKTTVESPLRSPRKQLFRSLSDQPRLRAASTSIQYCVTLSALLELMIH